MQLILLGPQGAGKGTQASRIEAELGVPKISTGDMLRTARQANSELGQLAASYLDRGALVPDQVMIDLIQTRLRAPDAQKGFVLDGFPRTESQADALNAMLERRATPLTAVLLLEVADEELHRRLGGRLVCESCGQVYHRIERPPLQEGICDLCGGVLKSRSDDTPEAIAKRLALYHQETAPLVQYYAQRGLLRRVDGHGTVEQVNERVLRALELVR